jgi:lipopolysaccharide transport system ATP-binding protein
MSEPIITVESLSKRYRIGTKEQQNRSFREVFLDGITAPIRNLRRLNRMTKFKENNPSNNQDQGVAGESENDVIWALKDVSFEVKEGEVLGIIGRNGAGKSTLLKILSRVTEPTTGDVKIYGRISSLLEVGTGFHPELTGRENIFLNGAILGMTKKEIERKFDEIIAFAETEKFLDTPVKYYSSGMYVRLAFGVAAHLEPEILIVDEVLAVGDSQFQKKCLGKMHDISAGQGRTILFVSHNMDAIQRLCSKCIMFEDGQLIAHDNTATIVARYLSNNLSNNSCEAEPNQWIDVSAVSRTGTGEARFVKVQYSSLNETTGYQPYSSGPLEFLLDIVSDSHRSIGSIAATLYGLSGGKLVNADSILQGQVITLRKGLNRVRLRIKKLYLKPGIYKLGLWLANPIEANSGGTGLDHVESAFNIEVVPLESEVGKLGMTPKHDGVVTCEIELLEELDPGR